MDKIITIVAAGVLLGTLYVISSGGIDIGDIALQYRKPIWYFLFPLGSFGSASVYWLAWEGGPGRYRLKTEAPALKVGLFAGVLGIIIVVGLYDKIAPYLSDHAVNLIRGWRSNRGWGWFEVLLPSSILFGLFVAFCASIFLSIFEGLKHRKNDSSHRG